MQQEPPAPSRELLDETMRARLEKEYYEEYVARQFRMTKPEEEQMLASYKGDRAKMQADLEERQKEGRERYAKANEARKLQGTINNFRNWLPRGVYRSWYEDGTERDEKKDALLRDIDEYIKSQPDDVRQFLSEYNSNDIPQEKWDEWHATIFPLFCAMKDKGHDTELMWR